MKLGSSSNIWIINELSKKLNRLTWQISTKWIRKSFFAIMPDQQNIVVQKMWKHATAKFFLSFSLIWLLKFWHKYKLIIRLLSFSSDLQMISYWMKHHQLFFRNKNFLDDAIKTKQIFFLSPVQKMHSCLFRLNVPTLLCYKGSF